MASGKRKAEGQEPLEEPTTSAGRGLDELICTICRDYLTDPVTIECGHNFCQVCITQRCARAETASCPQCGKRFQERAFRPNTQLGSLVQSMKQTRKRRWREGVCMEHGKALGWFCKDDGKELCEDCKGSPAHGRHTVVQMGKAALKTKMNPKEEMELLKKAREEISKLEFLKQNKPTDWGEEVKSQREQIFSEFNKLQTLLKEKEQLFLQKLVEEEEETLQKLQDNTTKLSQQRASLQQLIARMEEKCQQPDIKLLQDVRGMLARSEQARRQVPELSAAELKAALTGPGMLETLRKFAVDVTLDPDTAQPNLVLSEDRKRVRRGDTRQDLPDNPQRFQKYAIVLGTEGFVGGRCYWEVEVGDKTEWDLGVCRESVSRKGYVTFTPKNGYWVVWLRDGGYKALTSPWTPLPVSARPSRVGVFLDYEAGEVSFYNVTDRSHLFTFTDTFSGTLRPFFCPGLNAGGTNAAPLTIYPVPALAGGNPCP